jgi:hypothetical protein
MPAPGGIVPFQAARRAASEFRQAALSYVFEATYGVGTTTQIAQTLRIR